MKMIQTPGYKDLFGIPSVSYEEVLKGVSSETVIMLLISINAELNTSEGFGEKQSRLWSAVSLRFTEEQHKKFKVAFLNYGFQINPFDGALFGRTYLLAMLLKELMRNNHCDSDINDAIHEYNFLIAYLLLVDEVRKEDSELIENAKEHKNEIMPTLPLLWAICIRQYEFNQSVNAVYELFRLLTFLRYAYESFKPYLKELINKHSFQTLGQFMGSFNQALKVTGIDNPSEFLRKLVFIHPSQLIDVSHLKDLSCNLLAGKGKVDIADLRKHPLYETSIRGFMVVDENMLGRKVYNGPLFELHKETELKHTLSFEVYKTKISKDFAEILFFRSIAKLMFKQKHDISNFDDSELGKSDLFYRYNKSIILLEFKDYLFPDRILACKEFDAFKKYIDQRFVLSDREKSKGVEQLANNIDTLFKLRYNFDPVLSKMIEIKQQIKIYPIICHTDFMFGMPGINQYLNIIFEKKLKEKIIETNHIQNVTVIGLEVLFDYAMRGQDFNSLSKLIDRYWRIVKNRQQKNQKYGTENDFLATTISFDELYETKFEQELISQNFLSKGEKVTQLTKLAGLTQELLSEVL